MLETYATFKIGRYSLEIESFADGAVCAHVARGDCTAELSELECYGTLDDDNGNTIHVSEADTKLLVKRAYAAGW